MHRVCLQIRRSDEIFQDAHPTVYDEFDLWASSQGPRSTSDPCLKHSTFLSLWSYNKNFNYAPFRVFQHNFVLDQSATVIFVFQVKILFNFDFVEANISINHRQVKLLLKDLKYLTDIKNQTLPWTLTKMKRPPCL